MTLAQVFDPLFRVPLANGLLLALVLPLLGAYVRLRNEWLAALGRAQRPVAQRLPRHACAVTREDALLARQRLVVGVLRHHHMGQQPGACVAARDGRGLGLRGAHGAAARGVLAAVLEPRVLQHL